MTDAERALLIDERLYKAYGAPFVPFSYRDPVSELVGSLLSHRTRNAVTRAAFNRLVEEIPTWEEVIAAPTERVEQAISAVTFPEVKAPRIQSALQQIKDRCGGKLSLDFLEEMSVREARDWLEVIPGIGAKTSAAVLSFSRLRMPALVVDTHHQRVAQRLGLVPAKASLEKCALQLQAFIPEDWDGQRVYDSHQGFMRHGQRVCLWRRPACERCVIRPWCDYPDKPSEPG